MLMPATPLMFALDLGVVVGYLAHDQPKALLPK